MNDLCDKCKRNKAIINIIGVGNFCRECHNAKMINLYGGGNTFDYPKKILVSDAFDEKHIMNIEHIILGDMVTWEAREEGGDYYFKDYTPIYIPGDAAAQSFVEKVVDGICTKTVNRYQHGLQIKNKGNVLIEQDDNEVYFVVDGIRYTPQQFASLFRGYEGFNMQFRICDSSSDLLGENDYLTAVKIDTELLLDELEAAIRVVSYGQGFISYKNVNIFSDMFYPIYEKLRILYEANPEEAKIAGKKMALFLSLIESDDDAFPYRDIRTICELVDPHRLDEKLWGLIEE